MHASVLDTPSPRRQSIPARQKAVQNHTVSYLDATIPLADASHADVVSYAVETIWRKAECIATLADGRCTKLSDAWQFIGYAGNGSNRRLLFIQDGTHVEIRIDAEKTVVAVAKANTGSSFGEMIGDFIAKVFGASRKDGARQLRTLSRDRIYTAVDGSQISVAGCIS